MKKSKFWHQRYRKALAALLCIAMCISAVGSGCFQAFATNAPENSYTYNLKEADSTEMATLISSDNLNLTCGSTTQYYSTVVDTDLGYWGTVNALKFEPANVAASKFPALFNLSRTNSQGNSYPISSFSIQTYDKKAIPSTGTSANGSCLIYGTKDNSYYSVVVTAKVNAAGVVFLICPTILNTDSTDAVLSTAYGTAKQVNAQAYSTQAAFVSADIDTTAAQGIWFDLTGSWDEDGKPLLTVNGHFKSSSADEYLTASVSDYSVSWGSDTYTTKKPGAAYAGYSKPLVYYGNMTINYDTSSYTNASLENDKQDFITAHPLTSGIKAGSYDTAEELVAAITAANANSIKTQLTAVKTDYAALESALKQLLVTDGYYNADLVEAMLVRATVFTDGVFEYDSSKSYASYFVDANGYIIGGYSAGKLPKSYSATYTPRNKNGTSWNAAPGIIVMRELNSTDNILYSQDNTERKIPDGETSGTIDLKQITDGINAGMSTFMFYRNQSYTTGGNASVSSVDYNGFNFGTCVNTNRTYGEIKLDIDLLGGLNSTVLMYNVAYTDALARSYQLSDLDGSIVYNSEIAPAGSCPVVGGDSDEVRTLTLEYGTLSDINLDTQIEYSGRSYKDGDGNRHFAWAGNAFSFDFNGSSATAVISTEAMSGIASAESKNGEYATSSVACDVRIDGVKVNSFKVNEGLSNQNVVLCSGLTAGVTHTVEVIKHGGAMYGNFILNSISVSSDTSSVAKPATDKRVIEFVGDSITEGYGLSANTSTYSMPNGCNSVAAIGGVTADAFGANSSIIAASGVGLVNGFLYHSMPQMYGYTNFFDGYNSENVWSGDSLTAWSTDAASAPDVIVVNLGTNDSSTQVSDSDFTAGVKSFITEIRTVNAKQDIPIIFALGMMGNNMESKIEAIRAAISESGDANVTCCSLLPRTSHNGTAHPTDLAVIDSAGGLINAISEVTGWDNGYGSLVNYFALFNRELNFSDYNDAVAMQTAYNNLGSAEKSAITAFSAQDVTDIVTDVSTKLNTADEYITEAINVTTGASVRLTRDETERGIRFKTTIIKDTLEQQIEAYLGAVGTKVVLNDFAVSYGGIIAPTAYVDAMTAAGYGFNHKDLETVQAKNPGKTVYNDIETSGWNNDDYYTALVNIKQENYSQQFSYIAYVKVEYSGKVYYFYSDYAKAENARAISYVAQKALDDVSITYTSAQRTILQTYTTGQ